MQEINTWTLANLRVIAIPIYELCMEVLNGMSTEFVST
jgi:hypothetical protein